MEAGSWVESVGDIIIARVRGLPSGELLRDVQDRVLALLKETRHRKVVYDALELDAPSVEVTLIQQDMSRELQEAGLRIAIVVPNTKVAYLARLAFGSAIHRVFYNDIAGAFRWLAEEEKQNG